MGFGDKIKQMPYARNLATIVQRQLVKNVAFPGSREYWEQRYRGGGDSGSGSYGKFAEFKAEVLNRFVAEESIESVIEFGCGDGNQLGLAAYPQYLGFDVSQAAIDFCLKLFGGDGSKQFRLMRDYRGETAELCLSLDVIFHLVEDNVFALYMERLFDSALRYVIIYSSNVDGTVQYSGTHVKHRKFDEWVADNRPMWRLVDRIPNKYPDTGNHRTGSFADFFVYSRGG